MNMNRILIRSGGCLGSLLLAALLVVKTCIGNVDPVELARVRSPDGQVDAVVTESRSGGAWSSGVTWVFLVRAGKPVTNKDEYLVSANHTDSLFRAVWIHDRVVQIDYTDAAISVFANRWTDPRIEPEYHYTVELRLHALKQ